MISVARDGLQKAIGGERTEYKQIQQAGISGRQMHFRIPAKNGEARVRMFFVNRRWYNVLVMGKSEFVRSKAATRFLDSFRVSKNSAEPTTPAPDCLANN